MKLKNCVLFKHYLVDTGSAAQVMGRNFAKVLALQRKLAKPCVNHWNICSVCLDLFCNIKCLKCNTKLVDQEANEIVLTRGILGEKTKHLRFSVLNS